MAKVLNGKVSQFGSKGYGFIVDDNGEQYFVHQKNIYNKSRLNAGERVIFNVKDSEKGLVAVNVKLEKNISKPITLTDGKIKAMFLILFIMQIVTAYYVFLR